MSGEISAIKTASRITQIGNYLGTSTTASGTQSFTYDNAGRLLSFNGYINNGNNVANITQTQSFTYDANGNRLTNKIGTATTSTYTTQATSNRLTSITGGITKTNTYDTAGNLTSDGTMSLTYDGRGRMLTATSAGLTTSYVINYAGQRVKKANSTETVYYVYDDAGHMIGEYDAAGTLIQELIWLGDTPVALRSKMPCLTGGTCTETANAYIWTDHLNTPREITRVNASSVHVSLWKWDSLPFGETLPNANPTNLGVMTFNHRFPGQYRDKETGLHQNWNRDYDPKIGRYVESDPIGLSGGANTFSYCSANPVGKEDRNGLFELTICEVRFLESNYGETGAAIVAGFNLQSLASLPTETVDLVRTLLTLGGAGLLKAILPEYLELLGREICPVLADFGRNASAAASAQRLAGTISSAGSLLGRGLGVLAGPAAFATVGLALARNACFDPITGKPQ